jgi:vancomycin resistance protein YoaR
MAPAKSKLVSQWFTEYDSACRVGMLVYKKKAKKEGVNISAISFNDENDVYLTQHICIQKVLQTTKELPPTIFEKAGDAMFKLQAGCKWKTPCMQDHFLKAPEETRKIPWIKLTKENRAELNLKEYLEG